MNYGKLIKKKRTELGIKQKEMAKVIGISTPYLSNIETNKKIPSKTLMFKIDDFLEKKRRKEKKKLEIDNEMTNEKKYTKRELKEMEQEIIETYELMRIEKNPFSKIAVIQRSLIEINKVMEENMIILETALEPLNKIISKKLKRPLKTTIKNFEKNKERLENLLTNEHLIEED
jgi:putative ATP-dependent nuclease subunit A